ncbi:hypothetical protein OPQ81_006056 [Rhizoctonia solani]|nr:hypothetical protein OPQ81_006056 [Rhizoctonia solani]
MKVCYFWRHIVIACPDLWTHVDIVLNHPLNSSLLARAKVCAARAGKLPLEIHISDMASENEFQHWQEIFDSRRANSLGLANSQGLAPDSLTSDLVHSGLCKFEFLNDYPDDTVPIRSLELDLIVFGDVKDYQLAAITYFFARCRPGVFTQYATRIRNEDYESDYIRFIEAIDDPRSPLEGIRLPLSSQFLENRWLHTRVLRINGLCPPWSSTAYHGLVELHIGEGVPELHQRQLVSILRSSPRLRTLRLEVNTVGESGLTAPILLEDIEVLSLTAGSWFSMGPTDDGLHMMSYPGKILRLITTRSKPLQLTYFGFPGSVLVDFMARSNVKRLFIRAWGAYDMIPILSQCSALQTLILSDCGLYESCAPNLGVPNCKEVWREAGGPTPITQINTLYLAGFHRHCYEQLRGIVERYSVRKLVICGTYLWHDEESPNTNQREIESNLSSITLCPTVQYFESEKIEVDPEDWD